MKGHAPDGDPHPVIPRATIAISALMALNTAILVASSAGGAKMIALPYGLAASATVFAYAFSFTTTDVLSEIFGPAVANLSLRVSFIGLLVSLVFFTAAIHAPPAGFWHGQEGYAATLGYAWRLLVAGCVSYLVSQHLDVWLFHRIRRATHGRHLWLRNNLSTAVSQLVDSVIFITIAFYGVFPLTGAIVGQYLVKLAIALLDTPFVYLSVKRLRAYLATPVPCPTETARHGDPL